jgi:hypothetical protein
MVIGPVPARIEVSPSNGLGAYTTPTSNLRCMNLGQRKERDDSMNH